MNQNDLVIEEGKYYIRENYRDIGGNETDNPERYLVFYPEFRISGKYENFVVYSEVMIGISEPEYYKYSKHRAISKDYWADELDKYTEISKEEAKKHIDKHLNYVCDDRKDKFEV